MSLDPRNAEQVNPGESSSVYSNSRDNLEKFTGLLALNRFLEGLIRGLPAKKSRQ
ncbi:MAG TPA: hypothetical protein V6D03_14665 [Candidatus Caenarcaniphilales bacterium]